MLDQLTKGMFAEQVHTKFRVRLPDGPPLELELYEITEGRSTPAQEQFSLLFHGPKDLNLGQGTFELEHNRLGAFPLFLVPIGPDREGMRYEVVFNRFVKKPQ
jgi:hypothetical protein